jgi:glycosyltransferase involved in cell wall biosynthesis
MGGTMMAEQATATADGRVVVIIPARNEAANVPSVIRDVRSHLPDAAIVIVDDHSDDGTAEAAEAFPEVTVLRSPLCLGIGGAVQLGIKHSLSGGFTRFVRMDGDGQHLARDAKAMLASLGPRTLVQGSRSPEQFSETSNWVRRAGSLYFQMLFRLWTAKPVPDPTSGFMCFGRDIAAKFASFYPTDFPEIESLVLLIRSGHAVVPVTVPMEARRAGTSSIGPLHGLIYMFSVSLAFFSSFIRKNPYSGAYAS